MGNVDQKLMTCPNRVGHVDLGRKVPFDDRGAIVGGTE